MTVKLDRIKRLPFLAIRKIIFLIYLYSKTNFKGISKKKETDIILWTPKFNWRYYFSERLIIDLGLINALSNKSIEFQRKKDLNITGISNKIILMPYDKFDHVFGLWDYTKQQHLILSELNKQGNITYPTLNEYLFWENKDYMHEKFDILKIPHPKTMILDSLEELNTLNIDYPYLIKEIHSCSANGVHKVSNCNDLNLLKETLSNTTFLVQELLNMRKDLRVTIVGQEIVHYYWRINNESEWKPTSTGHGSSVKFDEFPVHWKDFILEQFEKLNITTGAFDIAWRDDDINTTPLFLEVSPTYQLNPITSNIKYLKNYGNYKKHSILGKESYLYQYIHQTFNVIEKTIELRRFEK